MFKVDQIDHIHVFVADRYKAAEWYENVLGLSILKHHEDWAVEGGPLTISSDDGNTSVALFQIREAGLKNVSTIAFRVGGEGFLEFLGRLESLRVVNRDGEVVTPGHISDHDKSYSIYFCDPDGNPIELTTYDYGAVRDSLPE